MSRISSRHTRSGLAACGIAVLALGPATERASAETFRINYTFNPSLAVPSTDPADPFGPLVADSQGRLYGSTLGGGANGYGTIFRLAPGAAISAPWTIEVLHSFVKYAFTPGGLAIGPSGEVYGSTEYDGKFLSGTVFRLDNTPGWPLTVLHDFGLARDGVRPDGSLTFGKDGFLYGSTRYGGDRARGTVYRVSPKGDAVSYEILHSFGDRNDGIQPTGDLIVDGDGSLIGTTTYNETYNPPDQFYFYGPGTAFRISLKNGAWVERTIYNGFNFQQPIGLVRGPHGNFFGCYYQYDFNIGATYRVFQLDPPKNTGLDGWTETDAYQFAPAANAVNPITSCDTLTVNPSGGFLGTSYYTGGARPTGGSVFSLVPAALPQTGYTLATLHSFRKTRHPDGSLFRQKGLFRGLSNEYPTGTLYSIRP